MTDSPEGAVLSFKNNFDLGSDHGVVYLATEASNHEFMEALQFTGAGGDWKTQYLDLRPYAGQQVQLLFNLYASDLGGGKSWYIDDLSVQLPDAVAPSAPTELAGTADTINNVTLTWTPSTDEDAAKYTIYRSVGDGASEPIGTTTLNTFTDSTAAGANANHYTVVTVDYSGNSSEPSNEVTLELPEIVSIYQDTLTGTRTTAGRTPASTTSGNAARRPLSDLRTRFRLRMHGERTWTTPIATAAITPWSPRLSI